MKQIKNYMQSNFQKIIFHLINIAIISLGCALSIKANIGIAPWDAVSIGVSKCLGTTIGIGVNITAIIVLFTIAIIRKGMPNIFCFVTSFLFGSIIDIWNFLFVSSIHFDALWFKIILFIVGFILIGIGVSGYLQTELPINVVDDFMVAIKEKLKCNVFIGKVLVDGIAMTIGFLLDGPIGVGTIILFFTQGFFIEVLIPIQRKLYSTVVISSGI